MRVLLTGASGFIGAHVLEALTVAGIDTVTVGRRSPHTLRNAHEHINFDLLQDPNVLPLMAKTHATHLLHCAWYAEHGLFWASPTNTRWVDASVRLVEAFCTQGGERVVGVGTCAEYDWSHGYCREASTPLNAATLYGVAKDATRRLAEQVCHQHDVGFAWGRIFSPFGAGENEQRLIPALIKSLRGDTAPMGINSDVYRDFLHVSDVARGLVFLLQHNAKGAYNISSGQPTSLATLASTLAHLLGVDAVRVLSMPPSKRDDVALLVGENRRLKELGWQMQWSLPLALQQTVYQDPI